MKEIKFSSISYNEIGVDGLVYHEYKWCEKTSTLTHMMDNVEIEHFTGIEARKKIKSIIGTERKKKIKDVPEIKTETKISGTQLKLF